MDIFIPGLTNDQAIDAKLASRLVCHDSCLGSRYDFEEALCRGDLDELDIDWDTYSRFWHSEPEAPEFELI